MSFVVRGCEGPAKRVNVTRGYPTGDMVEVFGALKPGDEVVRRGSDEIRENSPVQVHRTGKR